MAAGSHLTLAPSPSIVGLALVAMPRRRGAYHVRENLTASPALIAA